MPFLPAPRPTRPATTGFLATVALLVAVHPPAASMAAESSEAEVRIEALVREAKAANPGLAALRHAAAAARHGVEPAGALDDPMAGLAFVNFPVDTLATDDIPMTGLEVRWSQRLPWPGKRALRREIAGHGADAADLETLEAELRLEAQVRHHYYELCFLDRAQEITRTSRNLRGDMARISEERYAVGKGIQADVIRAQEAVTRTVARLTELEGRRAAVAWELAALLGRTDPGVLATPATFPRAGLLPGLDEGTLVELALGHRPLLARMRALIDQSSRREDLARKELRPDFTTGLAYRFRDEAPNDPVEGDDWISASIMINVPLWARSKQSRRVAQAREENLRWRALYQDHRTRTISRIHALLAELEAARDEARTYEQGVLVQARQNLEASRSAYEVNELEFLSFLDAERTLLEEEVRYWRLRTRVLQTLARLEAEVGTTVRAPAQESDSEVTP